MSALEILAARLKYALVQFPKNSRSTKNYALVENHTTNVVMGHGYSLTLDEVIKHLTISGKSVRIALDYLEEVEARQNREIVMSSKLALRLVK